MIGDDSLTVIKKKNQKTCDLKLRDIFMNKYG